VPDRAEGEGTQHADPIFPAVAQLYALVPWIVLPFDESKDGTFDRMADVRSHERVTVTPTAELGNGLSVVCEPVAVESVAGAGLEGNVKCMHDSGVEKGFPERWHPAESHIVVRCRVLWIGRDDG